MNTGRGSAGGQQAYFERSRAIGNITRPFKDGTNQTLIRT